MEKKSGKNNKVHRIKHHKLSGIIPSDYSGKTAEELYFLGLKCCQAGEYSIAIECLEKAIELEPTLVKAWHSLGVCLYLLGNKVNERTLLRKSIEALSRAIELKPDHIESWVSRVEVYECLEEEKKVSIDREKIKKIEPSDACGWIARGLFFNLLPLQVEEEPIQKEEVIRCYRKALEINPHNADAWLDLGINLSQLENYNEAIICYVRTIELNPEEDIAWHHKGISLEKLGKLEEAMNCYDKVFDLNPNRYSMLDKKGMILQKLGKLEEAKDCYEKALKKREDDFQVWYNLGVVLEKLGKLNEAINCFDNSLKLSPDYEDGKLEREKVVQKLEKESSRIISFSLK